MPRGWCWQGCAPSTGSCRAISLCSCTQNGGGTSSYILQHAPETACSWGEKPERRNRLESQRKASPTLIETVPSLLRLLQTHLSVLFCSFHCYGDDPRLFWSSTQQILLYYDNCHARSEEIVYLNFTKSPWCCLEAGDGGGQLVHGIRYIMKYW